MTNVVKNSVGIWAFGPAVTRFVPPGYHHEVADEGMVEKTERVCEGLSDLLDGLEYHYPGEVNEENAEGILAVLKEHHMELPVIAAGLHNDPTYKMGALINPDERLRRRGIDTLKRGIELAGEIGANFIIWPGAEGYNYTFQRPYAGTWRAFIEGVAELTEHAGGRGVKIFLEHKNSEPAMKILMQNIGMTLFTIKKVEELGVDTSNLLVNLDWQHLIMNGESLAEYAELLASENKLGHQHANDGWGTFDDDNVVGTNFFMQTLEMAQTLQDVGYGANGEIVGFDLYPYTEDQVKAVRRAILHWEFIWDVAKRIERRALAEAKKRADALGGQRAVYAALGLDSEYEERIIGRRKEAKASRSASQQ
ncbi:xylose isomerase [Rubrobacter taiwanensis]|uniref:Xylose isomerase n=1 Tax=Rubrobacter taiwanensis TaxID=185139 RepID=A0A4R1BET0_9ACTN|nr:xylose isomerase [Rubrobacter taiwanensis]